MEDCKIMEQLPSLLLPWYEENHRDLPWRKDIEPYHIWVSEIMLQQTRVEAVKGYYARFLQALPTIRDLSEADDQQLHKLWEGLGYYTRVRNLKKAAQIIQTQYQGCFPKTYEEILALPGIGSYTAGAISSIAMGLPTPAVDGNVLRVLSRLLMWQEETDKPQVKKQAEEMLLQVYPKNRPGDFTQALMELGATICGPNGAPDCTRCPVKELCRACAMEVQQEYPKRLPKKPRKQEERTVLVLRCGDRIGLRRRDGKGLLAGLWEFPNVPGKLSPEQATEAAEEWGTVPRELLRNVEREHIFTHIHWKLTAYRMDCREQGSELTWMTLQEIRERAALPTAFRQFMDLAEM